MSEQTLITYCAPTLAGMKTGNLFTCKTEKREAVECEIRQMNQLLNEKGVYVKLLQERNGRFLIYVYRPKQLAKDLAGHAVKKILSGMGYPQGNVEAMLYFLTRRIGQAGEFPHEIGLFLGYPAEDVTGFIENKGSHYKCCGFWKVYSDERAARELFSKYRQCTQLYSRKFAEGIPLQRLTVAG